MCTCTCNIDYESTLMIKFNGDFLFTVLPGQPWALSVQNIGTTWVRLLWLLPLVVDFPISYYEIIVAKSNDIGGAQHLENRSTLDSSTFINVTGLSSGTTYNFSVVAVIQAGQVVARSVESMPLEDIQTSATAGMTCSCNRPSSLTCHVTVVGGLLGSLLAASLLIIVILIKALALMKWCKFRL